MVEEQALGEADRVGRDGPDVGEDVEGAVGARAADAGHAVQPLDDEVPPALVRVPHRLDARLRAGERGERGALGGRVHARGHLLLHRGHDLEHRRRPGQRLHATYTQ